jgi:UDP-glucose:(heptosyl)LPS alpha-1,3-glucosyltransferase
VTRYKLAFAVAKYFEFGGLQRDLMRIATECERRGHEVHIYAAKWDGKRPQQQIVHVLGNCALTNHGGYRQFGRALGRAVAGSGFDCVIGATKIPGLDVYYAGDPCYAAKLDENRNALYRLLPRQRTLRALEAAVFDASKNTEIILIAHGEREKFIHYYNTATDRFHLLPPGIDKQRLLRGRPQDPTLLRHELGLGSNEFMLLNVASRFKTKGVDRVLRALAALPEAIRAHTTLVVVGDDKPGPYRRLAQTLAIGGRVLFTGAREDVASFYYAADLLIHPAYTENTGTTLLEAMVCGLPVLATANCGFAFHAEHAGAGMICPSPFRQARLNELLAEMLDRRRLSQWGSCGPAYCADTDLYSLVERAADVIVARAERNRAKL